MACDAVTGSIADRVAQSLASFEAIEAIEAIDTAVWVEIVSDQLSKFKLWAGNIGAHRMGRSSLDYRLQDSSHLHTQVVRLLDDLITSLNEGLTHSSSEDQDSGEADELDEELKDLLISEDFEFDSELGQLTKEIADTIGYLLRLSILLHDPAPHDCFMSTEYAKARYFEANDKAYVEAKFPKASRTLISTVALFVLLAMRGPEAVSIFGELDEDEHSERLRIPLLPKRSYNGPFECPFCFMMISVNSCISAYKDRKHVLRDLRPYVCLAEDCPAATKEYSRRHEVHGLATQMELDAMIARCSQTRSLLLSFPMDCLLCQVSLESSVDLAFFALPKIDGEDEELDERVEDQVTISTRSGSYSEALSDFIPSAALGEPTRTSDIIHEEHEVEMGLSDLEPLEDYRVNTKDGEWFIDELNDIEIRIKQNDSRDEPPHPSPTAESTIPDREVITHYPDFEDTDRSKAISNDPRKMTRRNSDGKLLCNACGLFLKLNGVVRPLAKTGHRNQEAKAAVEEMNQKSSNQTLQGQPPIRLTRPEDMRTIQYFSAIERQKYEEDLRMLWAKIEQSPPESEEHLIAKEKKTMKKRPTRTFPKTSRGPHIHRMARWYLSLETLRVYDVDYVVDQNPGFVLIK
ncbi:hypothetical protein F5Y09DRAFT_335293 [Xylaria sp. FL1042]|nr:hypothetical protein F5Y09DRAFT_335293 [Xylaria sp. FL1042]